jgi:SAM-dependent methyltransferase
MLESERATAAVERRQTTMSILSTVLNQRRPAVVVHESIPEPDPVDLDACFAELRRVAPEAFDHWHRLLDANAAAYEGLPVDSCSVDGHEMAGLFGCFLRPYLTGPTLDVGCGPQRVPLYLEDHPPSLLAGVDPLPPSQPHPFAFVRTVAEQLPWPDATFDLVVVATSLDHVLLLDRGFDEMARVLRPTGHLAIWVSFVAGAAPYDPYGSGITPVDDHHLFHFDRPWFESLMTERFVEREAVSFVDVNGSFFAAYQTRDPDVR